MVVNTEIAGWNVAKQLEERLRRSKNRIRPGIEFREEAEQKGWILDESIFEVVRMAAEAQFKGDLDSAVEYYDRLKRLPTESGGTFDLTEVSEVLKHNLSLMANQESR